MRRFGIAKFACAVALAGACCAGLASCAESTATAADEVDMYDTSAGVAATVNGKEIGEKAVTTYIENFRAMGQLEEDSEWAQWLVNNDYTVEDIRAQVVQYYATQHLLRQAAEENGVSINSDEVSAQVDQMRGYYATEEDWKSALQSIGTTEAQYRTTLELNMLQTSLMDKVAPLEEPNEEDVLEYCKMYATAYDGAKKSSHILFDSGDEVTAQEVLDKINSGELDFAAAAQEYSKDSSASDGGNVGWDKLTSFVDEYQDALDILAKDQVSGLVETSYGIHIVKCTDIFTAPEEVTSPEQLPSEFVEMIKTSVQESNQQQAFSTWYEEYQNAADIVVNDMPEGLSYAVDLTGYTKTTNNSGSSNGATQNGEGSADANAADSNADDASANGEDAGEAGAADEAAEDGTEENADASEEPAAEYARSHR